ncbi:Tryp_alpha_amyl domain-containing protein [Cephalotus follicularis]|uniref:Tryp_alpha_amyl domain-containing protein n=1 Tax=Cephalotus follicularis TaxID=3775 RepID=A0A1Q3CD16_CEPFO|nr:Tryp_alpha_amyl domain-containing protein [Cephalotus follicularis]
MAASPSAFKFASVVVMYLVVGAVLAQAAQLTYGRIVSKLAPYINYLKNSSSSLPLACCQAIRDRNEEANTIALQQLACECWKNVPMTLGINLNNATNLPRKCGVALHYKINPDIDFSK